MKKILLIGLFLLPGGFAFSSVIGEVNNANISDCCVQCAKNGNKEAQNCLMRAKMGFEAKANGNQGHKANEAGVGN